MGRYSGEKKILPSTAAATTESTTKGGGCVSDRTEDGGKKEVVGKMAGKWTYRLIKEMRRE